MEQERPVASQGLRQREGTRSERAQQRHPDQACDRGVPGESELPHTGERCLEPFARILDSNPGRLALGEKPRSVFPGDDHAGQLARQIGLPTPRERRDAGPGQCILGNQQPELMQDVFDSVHEGSGRQQ